MQAELTDAKGHQEARRHVHTLRGTCSLLLTAIAAVAPTAVVNFNFSPGRWWFTWVAFGLAIALTLSAIHRFGLRLRPGPNGKQRRIDRRLQKVGQPR